MPMSAVQETPARKQVPHALWNKQDRARLVLIIISRGEWQKALCFDHIQYNTVENSSTKKNCNQLVTCNFPLRRGVNTWPNYISNGWEKNVTLWMNSFVSLFVCFRQNNVIDVKTIWLMTFFFFCVCVWRGGGSSYGLVGGCTWVPQIARLQQKAL